MVDKILGPQVLLILCENDKEFIDKFCHGFYLIFPLLY